MEEISLKRALKTFKNRILVIIIITAVVFGGGCVYTFFLKKPLYQSTASVILIDDTTKSSDSLTFSKSLTSSYAEIIKSRKIMDTVVSRLGLNVSADELLSDVEVKSSNSTGVISVTVTYKDPEIAAMVANEVMTVFEKEANESYNFKTMSTVDKAVAASKPYNVNYVKDLLIYFAAGLVISLGVVFLVFYS